MPPLWAVRRILIAGIATAALIAVTAVELRASGGLPDWALITLAIAVGVLGPAESIARTVRDVAGNVSFDRRLDVEEAAKGAVVALTRVEPELSWTKIGITVFVVTRARAHFHVIRGVQERIVRIRMESTP